MTGLYQIQQAGIEGDPFALIPSGEIWGLVEFLSYQRVRAGYEPQAAFYKVSFPHVDADSARRLMQDWRSAEARPTVHPAAAKT